MVVVQVWDLSGQFPLGFQTVEAEVLRKAEELEGVTSGLGLGSGSGDGMGVG